MSFPRLRAAPAHWLLSNRYLHRAAWLAVAAPAVALSQFGPRGLGHLNPASCSSPSCRQHQLRLPRFSRLSLVRNRFAPPSRPRAELSDWVTAELSPLPPPRPLIKFVRRRSGHAPCIPAPPPRGPGPASDLPEGGRPLRRARARGGGTSRPLPTPPSVPLGGRDGNVGVTALGRGACFFSASAPLSLGTVRNSRAEPVFPPEPPSPRRGSRGGAGAGGEARRDVGRLRGLRGSAPALAPRSRCGRGRRSSRLALVTLVTRDQAGI